MKYWCKSCQRNIYVNRSANFCPNCAARLNIPRRATENGWDAIARAKKLISELKPMHHQYHMKLAELDYLDRYLRDLVHKGAISKEDVPVYRTPRRLDYLNLYRERKNGDSSEEEIRERFPWSYDFEIQE